MDDSSTSTIIAKTIASLAEAAARNTVGGIATKVKSLKALRDKDKTINELIEIINSLISDKLELEQIATTFQNELVSQQISDEDMQFIVNTVVPMVKKFTEGDEKKDEYIGYIESLLSKELVKVMQLIGFNYREAIGIPLTKLCADAISNLKQTEGKQNLQELNLKNQTAIAKLSLDKRAYNRFVRLMWAESIVDNDPENPDSSK